MHESIVGKVVGTIYGRAAILEYAPQKEKFQVEYLGQGAIGWLTESQITTWD